MSAAARNLGFILLKVLVALVLLALLAWQAHRHQAFEELLAGEKNWLLLAAGLVLTLAAVLLSFVRWFLIARAAGIQLPLGEAIRFGALGFALTFVGPGAVGGDLFKAVAVARKRKGQRAVAATTVLVDRCLGLLVMLMTACGGILAFMAAGAAPAGAAWLTCQATLLVTALALGGVALLFIPGFANERLAERLKIVPAVGGILAQIVIAWRDYQQSRGLLAGAAGLSLGVNLLLVGSFYCVARGLPFEAPSFLQHAFIVPMNLISAAIPITPGGVGVREGVADLMYQGFGASPGQGMLVAAGHSLAMLAAGGVAVVYYVAERSRGDEMATEAGTSSTEPVVSA